MTQARVDVAIVGGGMVGMATALACRERGLSVTVVDPGGIRDAASYGNAGVISRGSIIPVAGPGILKKLPRYALNREVAMRVDYGSLLAVAPWLIAFLRRCNEASLREAAAALDPLCAAAYDEHWRIAGEIGARDLIQRRGWVKLYRTEAAFEGSALERELLSHHKIAFEVIDGAELPQFEPALKRRYAKAVWHTETGSVRDPGALVQAYEAAARHRGVTVTAARARTWWTRRKGLASSWRGAAWSPPAPSSSPRELPPKTSPAPWAIACRSPPSAAITATSRTPAITRSPGRSTTRAGLCHLADECRPETPVGRRARPPRRPGEPRPDHRRGGRCAPDPRHGRDGGGQRLAWRPPLDPDGLPVIGRAPRHRNVVFAFGHGHIGLSTGPITGRLVAEIVTGAPASLPIAPFSPGRF